VKQLLARLEILRQNQERGRWTGVALGSAALLKSDSRFSSKELI